MQPFSMSAYSASTINIPYRPCPCGFLNFAFSAKFWSYDEIFAFLQKMAILSQIFSLFLRKIGHETNFSAFLAKNYDQSLAGKQVNLSRDQFFSGKAKIFVTSLIFGKNAKILSHDQNLAEKAKFKKPHGQGLSLQFFFHYFWCIFTDQEVT